MMDKPEVFALDIDQGNIYLSADVCKRYFQHSESVAVFYRRPALWIVPVQQASGGLLMKIRNAAGDRVIHAQDCFRAHGLTECASTAKATWDDKAGGLVLQVDPQMCAGME